MEIIVAAILFSLGFGWVVTLFRAQRAAKRGRLGQYLARRAAQRAVRRWFR